MVDFESKCWLVFDCINLGYSQNVDPGQDQGRAILILRGHYLLDLLVLHVQIHRLILLVHYLLLLMNLHLHLNPHLHLKIHLQMIRLLMIHPHRIHRLHHFQIFFF